MKQAKIQLTADIGPFKKAVDDAKKSLGSLNQSFKTNVERPMSATALQRAGKGLYGGAGAPPSGGGGMPSGLPPAGGGRGGVGVMAGAFSRLLAVAGVGMAYSRATDVSRGRLAQRGLTTDAGFVSTPSAMGFTEAERRANAAQYARAAGGISSARLAGLTDIGEQIQRAYGVSQDETAGLVGAARKAGTQDQVKFLSQSVGAAVAAGLEGSKIGEYLQGMQGFLSEMSQGVNIDSGSLNGMAAALSSLPFFKTDPARSFQALRGMNQAFQGGDRFQQAMSTRALLQIAPGASPAMTEFRRSMGLFGTQTDEGTLKALEKKGVDTRLLRARPEDIIKNMFQQAMIGKEGASGDEQMTALMHRLNLSPGAAMQMYAQGNVGDWTGAAETMKKEQMSPQERLNKTMDSLDGEMAKLESTISTLIDTIATQLVPPLAALANGILGFFGKGSTIGGISTGAIVGAAAKMNPALGVASMALEGVSAYKDYRGAKTDAEKDAILARTGGRVAGMATGAYLGAPAGPVGMAVGAGVGYFAGDKLNEWVNGAEKLTTALNANTAATNANSASTGGGRKMPNYANPTTPQETKIGK